MTTPSRREPWIVVASVVAGSLALLQFVSFWFVVRPRIRRSLEARAPVMHATMALGSQAPVVYDTLAVMLRTAEAHADATHARYANATAVFHGALVVLLAVAPALVLLVRRRCDPPALPAWLLALVGSIVLLLVGVFAVLFHHRVLPYWEFPTDAEHRRTLCRAYDPTGRIRRTIGSIDDNTRSTVEHVVSHALADAAERVAQYGEGTTDDIGVMRGRILDSVARWRVPPSET